MGIFVCIPKFASLRSPAIITKYTVAEWKYIYVPSQTLDNFAYFLKISRPCIVHLLSSSVQNNQTHWHIPIYSNLSKNGQVQNTLQNS